jgi:hypothetical protein
VISLYRVAVLLDVMLWLGDQTRRARPCRPPRHLSVTASLGITFSVARARRGGTDATALERRQAAGADVKRAAAIHATPHRGGLIVR